MSSVSLNVSGKANFSSELRCSFERFNTVLYDETNYVENGDCTCDTACSSSITFLFVSCFIVYALSGAPDCFFRDFINVSLCWFA